MKKFLLSLLVITVLFCTYGVIYGMTYYEKVDFTTGIVTASALNVRTGPGTNFKSIGLVYKNQYVRVFAKVGDWYVIQTENDLIGAVSTKYIKNATSTNNTNTTNTSKNTTTTNTTNNVSNNNSATNYTATAEEQELLRLINEQRAAYGLSPLKFDAELQKVAKIKAQDLVNKNYFSHNSPTYGSPFDMMKSFGITYKAAGENIAGNSTLKGAVTAWMNSQGHRENILSNAYNLTGIGVVDSPVYGKVMVQMFIGR
ncbi:MAG: SH3 domain-containing protein [Clostridia bacterium]|nr:SH3 domain-containing protein [Clostridia bacterium]